ncbi:MAG: hypothetical protein AVDCRST_MAG38-3053, partial [uncultured Solirubrobacteraceae bacterium]
MSRRAQAALGMAIAAAFAASAWPVLLGAPEQEAAAVPARVAGPQAGATAPGPAIAHVINTGGLESVGVIDGRGRGFELLRRPAGDPAWSPDGASLAVAE